MWDLKSFWRYYIDLFMVDIHSNIQELPGDKDLNLPERVIERSYVNKWIKAHWPTIMSLGGIAVSFLVPSLTAYAAAHPKTAFGILFGAIVAAYNSSAPKDKDIIQYYFQTKGASNNASTQSTSSTQSSS